MSDDGSDDKIDYEVGYKKPPKHSRFEPGVSGNPKGRPPGSKNKNGESYIKGIEDLILTEAYRDVEINENGERIKIPIAQAALRSLAVKAAKGDIRASQLLTKQIAEIERKREEARNRFDEAAINYKLEWEIEKERRAKTGEEMPDLLINPDDIVIDHEADQVKVLSKRERETLETQRRLSYLREIHREEIETIKNLIKDPANELDLDQLQTDLGRSKHFVNRINQVLPE